EPEQSAENELAYPVGPVSLTEYDPGSSVTSVPGDSAPGKLDGLGLVAVTDIVKSLATAVPPLSLMTCLITKRWAACCVFVYVHVMISPSSTTMVAVRVERFVLEFWPWSSTQTKPVSAKAGVGSPSTTV